MRVCNAWQLRWVEIEAAAKGSVPATLLVVPESAEMQISLINESVFGRQPAQPHRDVAARLNKRPDGTENLRAFVHPPEHFRAMVETSRTASPGDDFVASDPVHSRNEGRAARVQPGIVRGYMQAVPTDGQNSRHLAVNADGGHLRTAYARLGNAFTDSFTDRGQLSLGIFFDDSLARLMQGRLARPANRRLR